MGGPVTLRCRRIDGHPDDWLSVDRWSLSTPIDRLAIAEDRIAEQATLDSFETTAEQEHSDRSLTASRRTIERTIAVTANEYPPRSPSGANRQTKMARTRALLTERDRELLADEAGGNRRYQAISENRSRINEELATDVDVLAEHHPELLKELRAIVCDEE